MEPGVQVGLVVGEGVAVADEARVRIRTRIEALAEDLLVTRDLAAGVEERAAGLPG